MNLLAIHLHRSLLPTIFLFGLTIAVCGCSPSKLLDKQIAREKGGLPEIWAPSIDYLDDGEKPLSPVMADVYRLLESEEYDEAYRLMSRLVESDLANQEEKAEYYLFRGVTNRLMGNEKSGLEDLNKSIERNPNDWRAYSARHEAYERRLWHDKAVDDWGTARKLNPELPEYQFPGGVI